MTTATAETEVDTYLRGVRAALADLPSDVVEELLEDEPAHLAEVAAEDTGSLTDRLGPPEQYADELRAAAGLTGRSKAPFKGRASGLVEGLRRGVRRADTFIGPAFGYARAADLLTLLRPGWWILRGYLVGLVLLAGFGPDDVTLVPRLGSSEAWVWCAVVGVCLVLSVRLGRATPQLRRWGRAGVHAAGVLFIFLALADLDGRLVDRMPTKYIDTNPYSQVTDLYPYDADGNLLRDVRLYDQNGQLLQLGGWSSLCSRTVGDGAVAYYDHPSDAYPHCPIPGFVPYVRVEPLHRSAETSGATPSPSVVESSPAAPSTPNPAPSFTPAPTR